MKLLRELLFVALFTNINCQLPIPIQCFSEYFTSGNNGQQVLAINSDCRNVVAKSHQSSECHTLIFDSFLLFVLLAQNLEEVGRTVCNNMESDCFRSLRPLYDFCNFNIDFGE